MAASVRDLRGYDHHFVEPPPDDLICLICLCVARDPTAVERCSVRDVWSNTRKIQKSVPSVEKVSTVLLIKEVS
jgi:hypothetical protein